MLLHNLRFSILLGLLAVTSSTERITTDSVRTVFEFRNKTYVENIAVRPGGEVLVTVLSEPTLYMVDPAVPGHATLVYEFPEFTGLSGIAEYQPDVFACLVGNFSLSTGATTLGSWGVWSVDLNGVGVGEDGKLNSLPRVYKITDVTSSLFLNGLSLLSLEDQTLLAGDVAAGDIYRVDIQTGNFEVVINNTYTAAAALAPFGRSGVDGVHVRDDTLYFTNFGKSIFNRVRINRDGTPAGSFETISHTLSSEDEYDDFTFDCKGDFFLVTGSGNSIEEISYDLSAQTIIAGSLNSTAIAEPTAAAFGRRPDDSHILYVSTAGGYATPVDGDITIGGQLVAVTTTSNRCS